MRFKGLDLNLLVALDILLETRSVSRAAERLNLSQPAISAALARIRRYFGDEILVVRGKRMYPTAFAETLLPRIRQALRDIDAILATSISFDPASSQRMLRLVASDYIIASLLVPLVRRLAELAPNLRLDLAAPDADSVSLLESGKIDLLITPEAFIANDQPSELLFEEQQVVVGWSGNPQLHRPLTTDDYLKAGHIAVAFSRDRTLSFADNQIEHLFPGRRIEVFAPSFTVVPWMLQGTERLALMHGRLFRVLRSRFDIISVPLPFEFPLMREMLQYHHARTDDDGLRWLRAQLRELADESIGELNMSPSEL
jgi:LysR family nod box-dependent transcriptional activator